MRDGRGRFESFTWGVDEVEITTLTFASAPGACDGRLVGTVRGTEGPFASRYTFSVDFDIPMNLTEAQLFNAGCAPAGTPYSTGVDCCSGWTSFDPGTGTTTCA